MTWTSWIGLTLALFVLVLVGLKAYGASRWNALTRALTGRLEAARTPTQPARYDASELDGLPPPVQRYFRTALPAGGPIITSATAEHTGSFNVSETGEHWKPFSSTQNITTRPPGFVWDARVAILPGLAVHVHDAYVAGEGILHPAILGLFSIVDQRGTPELAQSELMRFFAEALWYPTALLPSQDIRWEGVDARSARATLVAGGLTLLFRFGEDGLIESARAEARGRTVDHRVVPMPWEGRWWNYQKRGAMRVPMTGEVAWLLPEGRKPYWRGTITSLTYEFME